MTETSNKKNDDPVKASEPGVQYHTSNIDVFTSFQEENEATAKLNAARPPEENFRIALEMIRAMYKKELEEERSHNNIIFTVINGLPVK